MTKKIYNKEIYVAALISLISVVIIFVFHIWFIESTFNGYVREGKTIDLQHIASGYMLHISHPVFAMRPITSLLASTLSFVFHLHIATGLILLYAIFFVLDGVLVYYTARFIGLSIKHSRLSILAFFLTFNIIFAFATNMHTYDEPVQYALLLGTLMSLFKKQYKLLTLIFLLALIARETSVVLIPGLIVSGRSLSATKFRSLLISIIVALVLYTLYYIGFNNLIHVTDESIRYLKYERFNEWRYSFQNWQYTKESIISAIAVLLPWTVAAIFYLKSTLHTSPLVRRLIVAFTISIIINTPLTFLTSRAQEARIFALPLIFLWPVLGYLLSKIYMYTSVRIRSMDLTHKVILMFFSLLFSAWFSFYFFEPTHEGTAGIAYQTYLFVTTTLVLLYSYPALSKLTYY